MDSRTGIYLSSEREQLTRARTERVSDERKYNTMYNTSRVEVIFSYNEAWIKARAKQYYYSIGNGQCNNGGARQCGRSRATIQYNASYYNNNVTIKAGVPYYHYHYYYIAAVLRLLLLNY